MRSVGFIERHELWTPDQTRQAAELALDLDGHDLALIRLAWADPQGCARTKLVTVPVFVDALRNGYNVNVATTTLDSGNARVFSSFTRGGGLDLDAMTGSPNITIVPDPATFRILPWAPRIGWVLCDEYFNDGTGYPFSPRRLLGRRLRQLRDAGMECRIGLEIEWYLLRAADEPLGPENIGIPGGRGRPPRTFPVEPGYSYHSETNLDRMQPVLTALAEVLERIRIPLRSIENEWGPGQVECTFSARGALEAADDLILFRTATRQLCRRMGYFATFMCRPGISGFYSSGWHLHQSIAAAEDRRNLFTPDRGEDALSRFGRSYLAGLLQHAVSGIVFGTPTVNGYRRFRRHSLAPDRASWGCDNRGAMLRVLGGPGDAGARIENRAGEPAANPYLFILSQIIAGLDGVARELDCGAPDDDPYGSERPLLPTNLADALDALDRAPLFRDQIGETFIDYYLRVKRSELGRFQRWLADNGMPTQGEETTQWEQNEYFDFF